MPPTKKTKGDSYAIGTADETKTASESPPPRRGCPLSSRCRREPGDRHQAVGVEPAASDSRSNSSRREGGGSDGCEAGEKATVALSSRSNQGRTTVTTTRTRRSIVFSEDGGVDHRGWHSSAGESQQSLSQSLSQPSASPSWLLQDSSGGENGTSKASAVVAASRCVLGAASLSSQTPPSASSSSLSSSTSNASKLRGSERRRLMDVRCSEEDAASSSVGVEHINIAGSFKRSRSSTVSASSSSSLFGAVMANANASAHSARRKSKGEDGWEARPCACAPCSQETPVKKHSAPSSLPPLAKSGSTTHPAEALEDDVTAVASGALPSFMSPGGFKLLDFVHSVQNQSPFPLHRRSSTPAGSASDGSPSAGNENHADERQEDAGGLLDATLDDPIVDWAVYRSVRIEIEVRGGDGGASSHRTFPPPATADIEEAARMQFLASASTPIYAGENEEDSSGVDPEAVRWRTSLLYWHLPKGAANVQIHFLTSASSSSEAVSAPSKGMRIETTKGLSLGAGSIKNSNAKSRRGGALNMQAAGSSFLPLSLSTNASLKTTESSGKLPQQQCEIHVVLDASARRWQAAFQSLCRNWMHRVRSLQKSCVRRRREDKEDDDTCPLRDEDCYFYSMGPGHSVLFRSITAEIAGTSVTGGCDGAEDDQGDRRSRTDRSTVPVVLPQMVISSTGASIRALLRDIGVGPLRLLDDWDDRAAGEEFQEAWLLALPGSKVSYEKPQVSVASENDRNFQRKEDLSIATSLSQSSMKSASKDSLKPLEQLSSPDVHAELTALRRAQAMGQTVGAAVSVSTTGGRRGGRFSSQNAQRMASLERAPPLVLTGWDDCLVFVEAYANTLGFQLLECGEVASWTSKRSTGSDKEKESVAQIHCQALELPSLACGGSLGPFSHASLGSLAEKRGGRDKTRFVTLTGVVLPSAVRQIVASTARLLARDGGVRFARSSSPANASGNSFRDVSRALFSQDSTPSPPSFRAIFHLLVYHGIPTAPASLANRAASIHSVRYREGRIGSDGTSLMNSRFMGTSQEVVNKKKRRRLRCGEVLSMLAWESDLPHALSYRVRDPRESSFADA